MRSGRGKTQSHSLRDDERDHSDDEERVHSWVRRKEAVRRIKTDHSATVNERTRAPARHSGYQLFPLLT